MRRPSRANGAGEPSFFGPLLAARTTGGIRHVHCSPYLRQLWPYGLLYLRNHIARIAGDAFATISGRVAAAEAAYTLGTGDKVHVTVFGETDLSGDYDVDGSGYMRLPLIGQVKAAGLTVTELENTIQTRLASGYLKNPRVSAEVTNYRPFYILGEVNKPGQYPYASGMNVLRAVALAGGFTYRADESDVYIRHKGSNKEVSVPANQSSVVEPGDVIRVTERFF